MDTLRLIRAFGWSILAITALPACADLGTCNSGNCTADSRTNAHVQATLAQHPALGAPAAIQVRTMDHVVYLYGLVDTELDREIAVSLASDAASPDRVVSLLSVDNR